MTNHQWTTQDYVYVTAECVTGVLSALGNSLVLLAIWRTRALRTATNCFIGSLAAADALVGLVVPPTAILPYLGLPQDFHGCVFLNTIVVLITNISILSLLAVALERYLAISDPFRYQRIMTVKKAILVVAATWVIAILIGLIPTMGWNHGYDTFTVCSFTKVIDMAFMIYLIFFGVNLPPLIAMLIIYLYIFYIIRKQQNRTKAQLSVLTREERRKAHQHRREVRGAKGLAYVIILFAVCWLPLHIMNSITFFAPEKSGPFQLLLVAIVLSHANSFVNPFLYALSNSQFKRAMKRMLYCGRLQTGSSSDSSDGFIKTRQTPNVGEPYSTDASVVVRQPKTNGHTTVVTVIESLYSEESAPEKHSALPNRTAGFVNNAFRADDLDISDDEKASNQPVNLQMDKTETNVHLSALCNDPERPFTVDKSFSVNGHMSPPDVSSRVDDDVRTTTSSRCIQTTPGSTAPHSPRQHNISPPITLVKDMSLYQHEEANITTAQSADSDHNLCEVVVHLQPGDDADKKEDEHNASNEQVNGGLLSPSLTHDEMTLCTAGQVADRDNESPDGLNVIISSSTDDNEPDLGSEQYVTIRL